jgi:tetratricopeptide (TPR) repeat protein
MQDETWALWAAVPASVVIRNGYELIQNGRTEEGRALLKQVGSRLEEQLTRSEVRDLFMTLGHSYRVERDWPKAVDAYRRALEVGPRDEDAVYLLSMSLRENGNAGEARELLRDGLPLLKLGRPYFVSSYYLQLGLAEASLGDTAAALEAMQTAIEWELRAAAPNQAQVQFIRDEMERLRQQ